MLLIPLNQGCVPRGASEATWRNSICYATLNGVLQMGASKMAASITGSCLQFKELLLLAETDGHFGDAFVSPLPKK